MVENIVPKINGSVIDWLERGPIKYQSRLVKYLSLAFAQHLGEWGHST
jgi:hypothetical protein